MITLEGQMRQAFVEFVRLLNDEAPFARENELVNLFVFGPLLRQVALDAPLHDARQLGVEVAVRQHLQRAGGKAVVRKDLVLWPHAGQTAWSATGEISGAPLAVLEWKGGRAKSRGPSAQRERPHDLAFLRALSASEPTEGYSVLATHGGDRWRVSVARVACRVSRRVWSRRTGSTPTNPWAHNDACY